MVMLQQDTTNFSGYSSVLNKYGPTKLKVSCGLVEDDIKRLRLMLDKAYNKSDKVNIQGIIKYLKSLSYNIDEDEMEFSWKLDKGVTKATPIGLEHFPTYGVRATDYILLEYNSMLKFDFTDLFKIIAFDMMHRDLGYETSEIDKKLDHIGIATIVDGKELIDFINTNDADVLDDSKVFKIGDSPYASLDGKLSWDYFGTAYQNSREAFQSGKYAECVGQSIDVAVSILNKNIIEKLAAANIKFSICHLSENGLFYLVEDSAKIKELISSKYFESAVIRSFGRRFEIYPKISLL